MAFLLRHDPKDMEISRDGFVNLSELLKLLRKRFPWIDESYIRQLVKEDEKERYEIVGEKIRARYGHSIDVELSFPLAELDKLYHGTSKAMAEKILQEGIKSMGRRKSHLSVSIEEATEVGRRKTHDPVILEVDAGKAIKKGVRIEKASKKVYTADYVPPKFIKRIQPA